MFFLKKRFKKNVPKIMKKHPQKLLIIGPDPFFLYWPGCLNGPKTEILYHQKSPNAGLGISTGFQILFFRANFKPLFQTQILNPNLKP